MSASPPPREDQGENADAEQSGPDQEQPEQTDQQDTGDMRGSEEREQGLAYDAEIKEQDRWLPIANVARIMKTALPENAKIAKEAKEVMQECVSEFISFITSEASEKCHHEKRKTVNGEDILFAMTSLGFENYSEALKIYLSRYRNSTTAKEGTQNRPPGGTGSGQSANFLPQAPAAPGAQVANEHAQNDQEALARVEDGQAGLFGADPTPPALQAGHSAAAFDANGAPVAGHGIGTAIDASGNPLVGAYARNAAAMDPTILRTDEDANVIVGANGSTAGEFKAQQDVSGSSSVIDSMHFANSNGTTY